MDKLNKRQKRFCDFYIETLNATQSAIDAGYSPKTARSIGYENLTKPYIQEYIQKHLKKKENDRIMSQDEVLERLTMLGRNAESDKDKLKALELMGKRYAVFTEKQLVENVNDPTLEILKEIKDANK